MKTAIIVFILAIVIAGFAAYVLQGQPTMVTEELPTLTETETEVVKNNAEVIEDKATERYSAQVDRVKVIFEQWDYTRYRLQTNELVREGEMNSERGFGDDADVTVYVLNWQKPEGEQIRYVRLTAEPTYLYALDGYQNIIRTGKLVLDNS